MLVPHVLLRMYFTNLQGVLAGKALVAVLAGERLDRKMNSLVTLQVMISMERLWTAVAAKWSIVLGVLCGRARPLLSVHVRWICRISTVETHW